MWLDNREESHTNACDITETNTAGSTPRHTHEKRVFSLFFMRVTAKGGSYETTGIFFTRDESGGLPTTLSSLTYILVASS